MRPTRESSTATRPRRCLYAGVIATARPWRQPVIALTGPVWRLWCRPIGGGPTEDAMAVTKDQVLASLNSVASPEGTPLPRTGTLSEVVAGDGKVFFSITVDAAEVKAWESVRKRAEEAVRALPGVQSALVALTAERKAGAAPARPSQGP